MRLADLKVCRIFANIYGLPHKLGLVLGLLVSIEAKTAGEVK